MPTSDSPSPASGATATPRSLADDLRSRSDDELAALLRARPDLLHPVPADLRALATRAATAPSVLRCLDRYDTFGLGVAELIASDESATSVEDVTAKVEAALRDAHGGDDAEAPAPDLPAAIQRVPGIVDDLRLVGMLWGRPEALRMIRTARDALVGALSAAPDDTDATERAVQHLQQVHAPDVLDAPHRDQSQVDRASAQAALELVRLVTAVIDQWSASPPPVLRAGGLGVRDLARLAESIDVDAVDAAFLVETAAAASLISDDGAADPVYAPTESADQWAELPVEQQWATLVVAWLRTPRAAGLVGTRDAKDQRITALGPDLERSAAVTVRRAVLTELSLLDEGTAPPAHDIHARIAWRRPRRDTPLRRDLIDWTLHEAARSGVTGLGALSSAGRALLTLEIDDPEQAAVALAQVLLPHLPPPVDHVILQPDLTAVAPGPLTPEIARRLAVLADVESTGGATVYRFTEASLRRGFDAGEDAADIKDFLTRTSRTPMPQPLEYLLDDIARRHGAVRVGAASSYLRCDDPEALTTLLAERVAQTLQLRRLAPTVAVSPVAGPMLLDRLQGAGYAPVLEGGDGVLVLRRPQPHRARPVGAPRGLRTLDEPPSDRLVTVALRALRHGEDTERTSSAPPVLSRPLPERSTPSKTLAVLRGAVADGAALRIGYAGSDGSTLEHLLDPVHVAGGQLTAYDHRGGDIRTFAVSRITGVEILTDRSDAPASSTEEHV